MLNLNIVLHCTLTNLQKSYIKEVFFYFPLQYFFPYKVQVQTMSDLKRRIKDTNSKTNGADESVKEKASPKKGADESVKEKASPKKGISLRILSRVTVIFSLLLIVYFSKTEMVKTFAKQSEMLPGKGEIVECSQEYMKEINKYEGCFPKKCKRFVTDKVISTREAEELLDIAKKGLNFGGSAGGASILDFHSGALSKGQYFVNIYKIDTMKKLYTEDDFNIFRVVKEKIKYNIAHHFQVLPDKMYLTHPTFFSKITPKKAVSIHDEYWHPHVDKETYKSFHYTSLLYLSDYNVDFEGGRFIFIDERWNKTIEPRKGRLSMFTSGAENLHYVEKVTSGVRYAITISFTCDAQFAIEDPSVNKYNE